MTWKAEWGYPQEYHSAVVNACAALMGDPYRDFFDHECSYEAEFAEGLTPEECAEAQYDALLG